MSELRKVAVFTGNRAEYGVLVPVIKKIAAHPRLDYQLLISGAHLDKKFGETRAEIEKDGFAIAGVAAMERADDTGWAMARGAGAVTVGVADLLKELAPDFLIVIGDRVETLGAAVAAFFMNVPIAHISGGDVARGGLLDDSTRHVITKLAQLHFTTNEEASERLRRLGEEPWRIHTAGSPSLDTILAADFAAPEEVRDALDLDLAQPIIVFTQHSITTEVAAAGAQAVESLAALEEAGYQTVLTYPNNDAGGEKIIAELEKRAAVAHFRVRKSLGRYLYLGLLQVASLMVGNSSSGLIESPAFKVPAVDIGNRQKDRLRAENVLWADYDRGAILAAIEKALHDEKFQAAAAACSNPYGNGTAGECIAKVLAEVELGKKLIQKQITY